MNEPPRKEKGAGRDLMRASRELAPYTGLGVSLAGTIVIFFFIGRWIDSSFHTEPLWTIIATFFGAIGGFTNFLMTVISLSKRKREKKDTEQK